MSQTYTSSTLRVSDGEVTSHDTTTVAEDISILSAQARWKGVTVTDSGASLVTKSDSLDSNTDTTSWADTDYDSDTDAHNDEYTFEFSIRLSGIENPVDVKVEWAIDNDGDGIVDTVVGDTKTFDPDAFWKTFSHTVTGKPSFITLRPGVHTGTERQYVEPGAAASVYAPDSQFRLQWTDPYSTTEKTTDPFVTRDVDASLSGTLDDGVWSDWVTLSGLETGVNEFYHNISGSGEAYFEFRYDWENTFPDALKELRIASRDGSQIHKVALADPADPLLDYNHVRTGVGGTVYAIDVVDPADSDALDWVRINTPNYGVVCPRVFETVTV